MNSAKACKDIEIEAYPMWIYIEDYCKGRTKLDAKPDLYQTFRLAPGMLRLKPGATLGIELPTMPHDKWVYLEE